MTINVYFPTISVDQEFGGSLVTLVFAREGAAWVWVGLCEGQTVGEAAVVRRLHGDQRLCFRGG